jgi:peptidyl-prolyl cis-trans isomerase C
MGPKAKSPLNAKRRRLWIGIGLGIVLLGGAALIAFFATPLSTRTSEPAIIVGEETISFRDFQKAYQDFLREYRASLTPEERANFDRRLLGAPGASYQLELKSNLADVLIRRTLLQQEARALGVEAKQSEVLEDVKRQLWRYLEENGVPPEQIERAINDPKTYRSAFTQDLMEKTRDRLLEERLRERVVGRIDPQEDELRAYYEQYRLRYYVPELVHVRHILIRVPEEAPPERVEAARKRIEEIYQLWKDGTDFQDLARRHSEDELSAPQGGDYGWIQRGDPTGQAFVDLAFSLQEPGEVGGPVRTERGFHLIQLVERRPEAGARFEDVADRVLKDYILEKTRERYRQWFEGVLESAPVDIKLPLLAAYRLEAEDPEAALREYERIRDEGLVEDPYLGYYIARLYRAQLAELSEKPSEERQARARELTGKIVENLKDVLAQGKREPEIYEAILELAPDDVGARFEYAQLLLDQGRWDEAAEQLAAVLERDPDHRDALEAYGRLLLQSNDFDRAAEHLERALALLPDEPTTREKRLELERQLAEAHMGAGRPSQARELLLRVLESDPQNVAVNRTLGEIALQQGDFLEAIRRLEDAHSQASDDESAELAVLLGRAYLGAGELDQAERAFQEARQGRTTEAQAELGLGDLAKRRGETERALERYREGFQVAVGWDVKEELAYRILEIAPDDLEVRFELAELLQKRKRYPAAIEQYREILKREPSSPAAWRGLGEAYLGNGRYEESIEAFQKGLAVVKNAGERAGLWARILRAAREQSDKHDEKLGPEGLEALYQLAIYAAQSESYEKAGEYLRQLLGEDPSYRSEEVSRLREQLRRQGIDVP